MVGPDPEAHLDAVEAELPGQRDGLGLVGELQVPVGDADLEPRGLAGRPPRRVLPAEDAADARPAAQRRRVSRRVRLMSPF
jgi:hypothetical protein